MDELIIKTWRELVFENPDLNTYEVLNKIQEKLNISYSDVINAISKTVDKDLILTKLEADEIIGINKLAISNLENEKIKISFNDSTLSLMDFLNNLYLKKNVEKKVPQEKIKEIKLAKNKDKSLKERRNKNDFISYEISLNELKEKALSKLNTQEYKIFTEMLKKVIDRRIK